ncbi:hypothetical protein L1887_53349 [Cichorium endivia]|nr:hypothetical protein L1887_53349 [Cichorium endivia]
MGPSRHTRSGAAAGSSASSRAQDSPSASALSTRGSSTNVLSKTPTRASPYTRTPTKHSSGLSVGPSTPSRTSSPMMLREIFSMISPFRGHSRARSSAAFGAADAEEEVEEEEAPEEDTAESNVEVRVADDRMIEDAEEGVSAKADASSSRPLQPKTLDLSVPSQTSHRSASPRPAASSSAPTASLPLANSALVTPGLRRQVMNVQSEAGPATPGPSAPLQAPSQTSPVSRNYDLLARFFAEKQRGGQGALTEVEVEGCIRLIEESMTHGRNLESEFGHAYPSSYGPTYPMMQSSGFAPSSRASSIAPPAMPSSQSMNSLFHPGTSRLTASSSAYSFLAPRAPAPQSNSIGSTDPSLTRHVRDVDDSLEAPDRAAGPEEAKRRRTDATNEATPSTQGRQSAADQAVQFESAYERESRQSSLLARDLASSSPGTTASTLKRPAPAADTAAPIPARTSPPKVPTRTASAIQDILKTTPPVRPPTKPELVNPYQSAAPSSAKGKRAADDDDAAPVAVRRSARTSMLTRAKARESARAAEKSSPPKESVLDLIERTAPKLPAARKKAESESTQPQQNGKAPAAESSPAPAAVAEPSAEERKLQKTEEVQRRLEALTKAKNQQEQNAASKTTPADAAQKPAKPNAALVPPQYTSTKPKKPSPLSAAFRAPDSPSSDSEAPATQPRGSAIPPPSFNFGSTVSASAAQTPSSGFSFSAPKPAVPATSTPSTGFSFSAPAASAATSASAPAPAPASAPAPSTAFSFTPAPAVPVAQKPAAAPSTGFSFSAPASAATSSPSVSSTPKAQPAPSSGTSPRAEVLAEDAAKLPKFEWQAPPVQASGAGAADRALRDEIKAVAQAALPKFDFIYEIEMPREKSQPAAADTKSAPSSTSAPSGGFSFFAHLLGTSRDACSACCFDRGIHGRTLFEVRAKFWKLDAESKSWKDLGVCITKLKHSAETGKHRLLARNEANGKVAVNFMTYKGLKTTQDKTINAFLGFDGKTPTQYRMKIKTEDQAGEFKQKLEAAAAKA